MASELLRAQVMELEKLVERGFDIVVEGRLLTPAFVDATRELHKLGLSGDAVAEVLGRHVALMISAERVFRSQRAILREMIPSDSSAVPVRR